MKLPKFKITQGIIHINSIDVMHCTKDILVFYIDCRQKRPVYNGEAGACAFSFYVGADENTLHVDYLGASETEVLVEDWGGMGDYWTFVECGRYGIRFAITKIEQKAQFVDTDNFTDGFL